MIYGQYLAAKVGIDAVIQDKSNRNSSGLSEKYRLTTILGTLLLLLPRLLRLCNQMLAFMDGMMLFFLVVCLLKCSTVCDAIENTGQQGSIPDDLWRTDL